MCGSQYVCNLFIHYDFFYSLYLSLSRSDLLTFVPAHVVRLAQLPFLVSSLIFRRICAFIELSFCVHIMMSVLFIFAKQLYIYVWGSEAERIRVRM